METKVPDFPPLERWLREYSVLPLLVDRHIMEFSALSFPKRYYEQRSRKNERGQVQVAGLVICPHRPPTRSGRTVVFLTLEDEFGLADVTIFENIHKRYGEVLFNSLLSTDYGGNI